MSKKVMKKVRELVFFVGATTCLVAAAGNLTEGDGRETFGKWRVGVGAAFNCGVKARLSAHDLPMPRLFSASGASTKRDAWRRAYAHLYDGGGYIAPDSLNNGYATENWRLPVSDYLGNGAFDLGNAYQEVVGSVCHGVDRDAFDSEMQYGISIELVRELWIHDENDEHRWGLDLAVAFSYFFRREIYDAHGVATGTGVVRDGTIRTLVDDPDAMWRYDHGLDTPAGGMYGHGNYDCNLFSPALGWDAIGEPFDAGGTTRPVSSSYCYNASGDYQELEMLFVFRPWYEITDWWRIFAQVGAGVSWGRFDCSFHGSGISADEEFSQWDVYGVAGLGTAFRYGHWDLGIDFLGRFLRDDLDVDGRYVSGSIDRADWGFRVMLGYSF